MEQIRKTKLLSTANLLEFVNQADVLLHSQAARPLEREALVRIFQLMNAIVLSHEPEYIAEILRSAHVYRNVRVQGQRMRELLEPNELRTEIDAIILNTPSPFGHLSVRTNYIIEVERKTAHGRLDYIKAKERAKRFSMFFSDIFGQPFCPIVVLEEKTAYTASRIVDGIYEFRLPDLKRMTGVLYPQRLTEFPGFLADWTLVKLFLLELVARTYGLMERLDKNVLYDEFRDELEMHIPATVNRAINLDKMGKHKHMPSPEVFFADLSDADRYRERFLSQVDALVERGYLEEKAKGYHLTERGSVIVGKLIALSREKER